MIVPTRRTLNRWPWLRRLALLLALGAVVPVLAQQKAADPQPAPQATDTKPAEGKPAATRAITVKLVSDLTSGQLVSDLEEFQPVTSTSFGPTGSTTQTIGEACVLWVRNAHVDGKFFFERYYQGKYIDRRAELSIDAAQLATGQHVIEPGGHKFTLSAEGRLASDDPDIRIDGDVLMLRLHKVSIYGVDGAKSGPAEFRKLPTELGLFSTTADFHLDPAALPDPTKSFEPVKMQAETQPQPAPKESPRSPLVNLVSHQKPFYPLLIWLPANQVGQGYLLYPSWQAFHLSAQGKVQLSAAEAPRVPGIEATDSTVVIPYRRFGGKLSTTSGLAGGVGNVPLGPEMNFGATLAPIEFRAGFGKPDETFFLPIDNDLTRRPSKFFLADNTSGDNAAVRLMAVEWQQPVFEQGAESTISLRLLETPSKETIGRGQVRMSYSPYQPASPATRTWQPVEVLSWTPGREEGPLKFRLPQSAAGFVILRVQLFAEDATDAVAQTPLEAEISACIISPGQQGTASFVTNKGRSAFVAGEPIELTLVLRSSVAHAPGQCSVVLTHPDGYEETLTVPDSGQPWQAESIRLSEERTLHLVPGRYRLSVTGLPDGIVASPLEFDLVGRDKPSLYHVVKTSKYTQAMNNLEPSHNGQGTPIDLDRAMRTLAELGYTRVDLMSYMTNHHLRGHTWREELASGDPRLPAPASVYTPNPRDQILNACVRNQLQYSDVWLSYNDFHLPRYIESYIRASERWIARELQAMRHSPALDGMMLYDEMYQSGVTGLVETHQKYFANVRARLAADQLGQPPAKIEEAMNRYLERPRSQRDPEALAAFIRYKNWQQLGWADYVERMVHIGKQIVPGARFGTYHRTWASPGTNDDIYNGYPPDLFHSLDIISHVHYADNSTCWVSIPLLAQALRTGHGKTLYINMPLTHEVRSHWDGQYERQMAFALLAQGANGIAQWGLPHTFDDGPNPGTAVGREVTAHLNHEILRPFGEVIDRTQNGYRKVGIVSTLPQHALGEQKKLAVAHQTEGIWIACWRLGYPAVFLREEHMQEKLDGFQVIFVPGVRFDGELDEAVVRRLEEAIAAGTRVVVEQDSALRLPGITRLDDWPLDSYYVGNYFPTWADDELNKVYQKSQPIVDYLGPKLIEWRVEPAARGPFKVGPGWRDGGAAQYLVMANFEDPDYGHTVKQQMAKPVQMPMTIAAHRGRVAYDLLAGQQLELEDVPGSGGTPTERKLTLDMRRVQGALVALLPEPIGRLQVDYKLAEDRGRIELAGSLVGTSGEALDAVFPARITVDDGHAARVFYRVLGRGVTAALDLPFAAKQPTYHITVREALGGHTARWAIESAALAGPTLELAPQDDPQVPYPDQVRAFLAEAKEKEVVIVPARSLPGVPELADKLAAQLKSRGIRARVADEQTVYHTPTGDLQAEDPLGDGFHSWRAGQEVIAPATVVDSPAILLGGRHSSLLIDTLATYGYLTLNPIGEPGLAVRPSLQVATKGLHYQYDALCLVANEAGGIQRAIERLLEMVPQASQANAPKAAAASAASSAAASQAVTKGPAQLVDGEETSPLATALNMIGTNEMVLDAAMDPAGNVYVITWGHGKNLYSFTPEGKPRFARFLPEMGATRLDVFDDRLYVYTSAGARLYQLGLDGQGVLQARLNMDPGSTSYRDQYSLSQVDFRYLPDRKQLLHNMGDRMRLLDEQFGIVAEWQGEAFEDKDVSDETLHRQLGAYVVSPDGQRIAQLESSYYFSKTSYLDVQVFDTHLVIRDMAGKLLAEAKDLDNYSKIDAGGPQRARLAWPDGAPGPIVYVRGQRLAFSAQLEPVGTTVYEPGLSLGGERRLIRDGRTLLYYDSADHLQCRIGPLATMPTYWQLSPDGAQLALLDEYGRLLIYRTSDGALGAEVMLPQLGQVLRFAPDSQTLIVGGFRGRVAAYDLAGSLRWQTELAPLNDILGTPLPLYDASIPDATEKLWPVKRDEPGELEKLVRMGADRLTGGDCETEGPWQGQAVAYHPEGYQSARSLKVGADLVSQEVTGFLGSHVTWVLEFYYRSAQGESQAELLAGLLADGDHAQTTAVRFSADDQWRFGRVAIKNGANCSKLTVGFSTTTGAVLVDQVTLRRIRFPSVNHLLYDPLYAVEPVVLDNPLFSEHYNPCGALRDEAPNRVLVENLQTGPLNLVESAFLQNGRLNEVTSNWYIQPVGHDPTISLGLKEPRWISLVGLYFNVQEAANVTPHFDIYVTDMETNKDRLVASVRHNTQLFRLVKFPPVKTPLVKIKLVNSIARLRTLTEIELYGPLSGIEGTPGFVEPEGQNTYMGDFTRVDKRVKTLPTAYLPPIERRGGYDDEIQWCAPLAQILASDDRFFIARTFGKTDAYTLAEPTKPQYLVRSNGLGYTPYGTLYGGLLIRCGNDGRLYCISPDSGAMLWSTPLGERLFGAPVAVDDDLLVASDNGKLYQVDFASGSLMKEAPLPDKVFGSLATDGVRLLLITADGVLRCFRVADLEPLWQVPLAQYTDGTPAVDGGVVYVADRIGTAWAIDASTGSTLWRTPLGDDEFMTCPVVMPTRIVYGCRGGTLAVVERGSGKLLWSRKVQSRFYYGPLVLKDRVLYFDDGKAMLANLEDGGAVTPLVYQPASPPNQPAAEPKPFAPGEPAVPLGYYKGTLLVVPRTDHQGYHVVYPWHVTGGTFTVLKPAPVEVPEEAKAKP